MKTDISIVIVTYNSQEFIRRCLTSVLENRPRRSHRIVVVDNASSDETASIVRAEFPQVELVCLPENVGFGRGNNAGFEHAPARFYYCHNADAYLQANVLDPAIDLFDADPKLGIVGLPLVFPDFSPQTSAYSASTPLKWALQGLGIGALVKKLVEGNPEGLAARVLGKHRLGRTFVATHAEGGSTDIEQPPAEDVDWVCGAAMIIRDAAIEEAGHAFDPDIFMYGEDEELCLRASRNGWKVKKANVTPVIHEFGWGKSVKASRKVVDLKFDGLRVFIDKTYRDRPISRLAMHAMLRMKYMTWKARSAG
ncbi:glycosyltransferase family 2 protein [Qipengyuania sp. 1NDW9]|uniref:glycosyltransferase family 2 protein n=1 Tax=Qipengyuania xiapuensis TaxID=2867236 RepID=UPI001C881BC2|nr:glycosyltransferase family 2 protein [Qipengyuania xiapuensis]